MTQKLNFDDPNAPCFIIAEVGQTHDGSLGVAHAFIDAIANAGADAVKFQTHIASGRRLAKRGKIRIGELKVVGE